MQMTMNIYVFWLVKPFSLVANTNVSEQTSSFRTNICPKNGDNMLRRNVGTYPPNCAGLRRQKTAVLRLNATLSKTGRKFKHSE